MIKLLQIDFKSMTANKEFATSLAETGFAVLKNHPINPRLIDDVFKEWAQFFASKYKDNYIYNNETQDGFFPMTVSEKAVGYNVKDIKEFYHYYKFGQYPKELSNKTKELREEMNGIALTLLSWIEENLPTNLKDSLSMPITKMVGDSNDTLMRILHYPPLTGSEEKEAIRASAHTDINLITILVAASQAGLQLKNKNGKWLEVPLDPGMLSINIGDMLQEATQGFYKSTIHQVVNPDDESRHKSRYSIPLFVQAKPEVVLSDRYTAKNFWDQRLAEIGIKK